MCGCVPVCVYACVRACAHGSHYVCVWRMHEYLVPLRPWFSSLLRTVVLYPRAVSFCPTSQSTCKTMMLMEADPFTPTSQRDMNDGSRWTNLHCHVESARPCNSWGIRFSESKQHPRLSEYEPGRRELMLIRQPSVLLALHKLPHATKVGHNFKAP